MAVAGAVAGGSWTCRQLEAFRSRWRGARCPGKLSTSRAAGHRLGLGEREGRESGKLSNSSLFMLRSSPATCLV